MNHDTNLPLESDDQTPAPDQQPESSLNNVDSLVNVDPQTLYDALKLLSKPFADTLEAVIELRIMNVPRGGTVSGYFTDLIQLTAAVAHYSGWVPGIYTTLNPVNPVLFARAANRAIAWARHTTSDADILYRGWLPLDFDPVRPSGISATEAEHEAALQRARECRAWLQELGWPLPAYADSGNGAHLLYRIDLPNDPESTNLIKRCLEALDFQFSDKIVQVDRTTYNAARIWKLYGTKACKGDDLPDRPHRLTRLLDVPEALEIVTQEKLVQLAAIVPQPPLEAYRHRTGSQRSVDLASWIRAHHLHVVQTKPWQGGHIWIFNPCPWNAEHTNSSAYLIQWANGSITAGCHHNGCAEKDWYALRDVFEPGWRAGQSALPEEVITLLTTIKENRDPAHVYDAVDALAGLSASQWGKIKAELKDILGVKLNLNNLERAVNEARRQIQLQGTPGLMEDGLPGIPVNDRPPRAISTDALQALVRANTPPTLFIHGERLVRLYTTVDARTVSDALTEPSLRGRLMRVANFLSLANDEIRYVYPPREVVQDLLTLHTWPDLPALEGIVTSPIVRPDGTILDQPGYDPSTRLIYAPPPGFALPPLPATPSREDVQQAATWLSTELLHDFPFALDAYGRPTVSASQANALALLLTPILRPAIPGLVPLGVIEAPQAGTGKTLLASVIVLVATGYQAAMKTAPREEAEWGKLLTAILCEGAPLCVLDNVHALWSDTLAAVLTARTWTDRLLGSTQMLTLPQRTVFIATGNNVDVGGDLPRRCYWIRLNADTSRPWQRTGFRHQNLLEWVEAHRGEVLAALFTVIRGWYVAGKPAPATPPPTLGSFEAWTQTLAGILAYAGVPGFLGNLESQYSRPDANTQRWEAFFLAWAREWAETPKTVREVVDDLLQPHSKLRAALPEYLADVIDDKAGSATKRLGQALRQQVDVRQGDSGISLARAGQERHTKTALWCVHGFPPVQKRPHQTQAPASPAAGEQHTPLPPTLPARVEEWPEDWRDAYEERAALLEEGGQLSRAEAKQRAEREIRQAYQQTLATRQTSPPALVTDPPAAIPTPVPEPLAPVTEDSQDITTAESAATHAMLPSGGQTDLGYLAADLGLDLDALSPRFGLDLRTLTDADALIIKKRILPTHREAFAQLSDGEEWALHVYLARCINVLFPSTDDHTEHDGQES